MTKTKLGRRHAIVGIAMFALVAAGLAGTTKAHAQPTDVYPSKLIRIICAFPPGNSSDVVARLLAEHLQKRFGQSVVVENRPGASGILAATAVQKSAPDGYTLLMTSTSFVINNAVLKSVPYDVSKDFAAINLINSIPAVLLVNKEFPANTPQEFIAEISRRPGAYSYGHPGVGTIQNMSMKLFQQKTNANVLEVPYKGSVQAITDITGGTLHMMFEAANSAYTFVNSGRVKAIATTGPSRYYALPDVPTLKEAGLDVQVVGFTVLMAPAGTPTPILAKLNGAVQEILKLPETQADMKRQGMEVYPQLGHADVAAWLASEGRRWEQVAAAANIVKQ